MIVVDVDSASLSRARLTPSPAHELIGWLRLAAHGRRHPAYGDPGPVARAALLDADVALVAAAVPATGYLPDLLTPKPPLGSRRTLDDQLELVAQTDAATALCQLSSHRAFVEWPAAVRVAAEHGEFARRTAQGMRKFWDAVLLDGWAQLGRTLEHDIDFRARELARSGIATVLGGLHPTLRWNGNQIEVHKPYDEHTELRDTDVVLAPSALCWPSLLVQLSDPTDMVVCYPAVRIGVGREPAAGLSAATAELIGATRNRLLEYLDEPWSTTELSTRTGLAPATVSHHLGVLLRSGLLFRERRGRTVVYRRNNRGDALITRTDS